MAKVIIRQGNDWMAVLLDDQQVIEGHSAGPYDWAQLLKRLGVEVVEEQGDFCTTCSAWIPQENVAHFRTCEQEAVGARWWLSRELDAKKEADHG